jgi:oxygen-dependent protoporphyrinogen oxidase
MRRFAVIGGGIAGLCAAHRLHRRLPHATVRVFEARDRLGGPLHTLHSGELLLEQGADSFLTKTPYAIELCRELGLATELVPTNERHRRALVVRDGRLLPVPEGFVLMRPHSLRGVWESPVLSLAGKLRLLAEPLVKTPAEVNRPGYDESVASFARRRLGRQAFERLVQPLIAGIFVADAERLSLAATFPEFLEAERRYGSLLRSVRAGRRETHIQASTGEQTNAGSTSAARYGAFVTVRNGLKQMIDAITASLPADAIRLSTPVHEVRSAPSGRWTIAASSEEAYDGVIIATSANAAAALTNHLDSQLAENLSRIEYASSAVITLVYDREQVRRPLDAFGVVVPAIEGRRAIAISFPGTKFSHMNPGDRSSIRVFVGGALNPQLVDRDDNELKELAHQEIESLVGVSGRPVESLVARWRNSMPQYHVGHLELVAQIERQAAAHKGLSFAGSGYRGVGIPQCIHSGRGAADRLVEQFSRSEVAG